MNDEQQPDRRRPKVVRYIAQRIIQERYGFAPGTTHSNVMLPAYMLDADAALRALIDADAGAI